MSTPGIDYCPACGREITDNYELGMEAEDGQRWCRDHFARRVLAIGYRIDSINEGHVVLSIFIGRNPGARGHSGKLTLRTDEFRELCKLQHLSFDVVAPTPDPYDSRLNDTLVDEGRS